MILVFSFISFLYMHECYFLGFLFCLLVYIHSCQYNTVLIITTLQHVLKSESMVPPTVLLLLRIALLGIHNFLFSIYSFKIYFIFVKNVLEIMRAFWTFLDILTILPFSGSWNTFTFICLIKFLSVMFYNFQCTDLTSNWLSYS